MNATSDTNPLKDLFGSGDLSEVVSQLGLIVKKLEEIYNKFNNYITISFIFDKHNLLPYKASPTDLGKDIFLKLFKERIYL